MYIHISTSIPICDYLYLYYDKHEFILMPPSLIHYSSLLSLLSVNSQSNSEKLHLVNCSVPVYTYNSIRIFKPYLGRK